MRATICILGAEPIFLIARLVLILDLVVCLVVIIIILNLVNIDILDFLQIGAERNKMNPNKITAEKALTLITIASIAVDITLRIVDKLKDVRKKEEKKEVKKEYEGV